MDFLSSLLDFLTSLAAWVGVVGAVVGGVIGIAGTLLVERRRERQAREQWQRDIRLQALLDIQGAIRDWMMAYMEGFVVESISQPNELLRRPPPDIFARSRIGADILNLLHRIGDEVLGEYVSELGQALAKVATAPTLHEADSAKAAANVAMTKALNRVGVLLAPLIGISSPLQMGYGSYLKVARSKERSSDPDEEKSGKAEQTSQ